MKMRIIFRGGGCDKLSRVIPAPGELNEQQQKAVDHDGSVLVLSGAGTGKTRVIIERIAKLLRDGVSPAEVMAVTFTNRAAREMRMRVGRAGTRGMFIGTFHAFCLRWLQRNWRQAGLPEDFRAIDDVDQRGIVKEILGEMRDPESEVRGPERAREKERERKRVRQVASYIGRHKEGGLRAAAVPEDTSRGGPDLFREAYKRYEARCENDGLVDFAEMLLLTCETLEGDRGCLFELREGFRHVLIDELQDINPLQIRLLRSLQSPKAVFFGVGDDDQSIYRFRGADPGMLDHFAKRFAGGSVLRLERNYRSTDPILKLANRVIERNRGRMGKTLTGVNGESRKPQLVNYATDEREAAGVAADVDMLIKDRVPPGEIAILYRNNSLSQLVEMELTKRNVRFKVHGGLRFFARAEVRDVLAYLQAASSPDKYRDSVRRSINTPPRGVGEKTWEAIEAEARRGKPIWEVIESSRHRGVRQYAAIVGRIREAAAAGDLEEAVRIAVDDSTMRERLVNTGMPERALNLDEIISAAARHKESQEEDGGEGPGDALADFLQSVTIDSPDDELGEVVTLITIHSAKGTEFDNLYIIGLEKDVIPSYFSESPEDYEEERRLLFVAITRARRSLTMSHAEQRRFRGEMRPALPSSFLKGVVEEGLAEFEDLGIREELAQPGKSAAAELMDLGSARAFRDRAGQRARGHGFRVGQNVVSERFGKGEVIGLSGEGDGAKARVRFRKDGRERWLALGTAKLRLQQSSDPDEARAA